MKNQDEQLFEIVQVLEEHGSEDLIKHLAHEIGAARIREAVSRNRLTANTRIHDLMADLPMKRSQEPVTYYDMQSVGSLAKILEISTSYVSNMANNRNANKMHIEREIQKITNNRTFYSYRVEPGFDIAMYKDSAKFDEDFPRFIRRSIIRFAEEGLGRIKDEPTFTPDEFKARFSKDTKPSLYEPYKGMLVEMIADGELFRDGGLVWLHEDLIGTQKGCTIVETDQSELWIELSAA